MVNPAALVTAGKDEPLAFAIIGLSCRLPGASSPEAFWQLLRAGRSAITEPPPGHPQAGGSARRAGYLDGVDRFDPEFFGISPREARTMDPQQRLMLELSWEALEDAGLAPESLAGSRTGVFIGAISDDYATLLYRTGTFTQHTLTGAHRGIIANRVSYFHGLRGPSLTVDAAQSSSLVAVHLAVESLRRGESAMALAGGVNLNLIPESTEGVARFGALSPDDRCFTFDARANGYVRGEGGAFVVIKPLDQAVADGDDICCVITASAINNDGATEGLTVPSAEAQAEVLRLAYASAGVSPDDVQYVELHGTGTPVGDPVEAAALGRVLGAARRGAGPLLVGSAKTNVGHLEGAAGIVGLLKAALSLRHREVPPSLNFASPNPRIDLEGLGLAVATRLGPWPDPARPLVAGVSSFGMGGTNCHVVLSEPPARSAAASRPGAEPLPWVITGHSARALRAQARLLREHLDAAPETEPADIGYSLATARGRLRHRAVLLAGDQAGLLDAWTSPPRATAARTWSRGPPAVTQGRLSCSPARAASTRAWARSCMRRHRSSPRRSTRSAPGSTSGCRARIRCSRSCTPPQATRSPACSTRPCTPRRHCSPSRRRCSGCWPTGASAPTT